mmetsp:Transcript_26537/g.23522  ORF Transcript_26537/g.23522 Transcript_26537/m.23522 type:complete len:99 (+) Transcript_26537:182-478(+)|eukprot:CAMPEP_0114590706 /NCGR_PEP_ID=MMETSP0125-20121206/12917_1 /TAXON_ID=485358 ORGANISM="Aristerostoma sp., Strain ATCC 50986" /NCGR_SAMPLE_ID=MMETSP0125 /ASSEMBLY_ACC=CAM_ASM_000245 /LENGTH=98 /DNA_ID=CAMNT_0001788387 /DNA_START=112 /DNA_END=408 /DNA_ORIENTATION=+
MSTSLDQVIEGTLPIDQYNQKVQFLVSEVTENCQDELEDIFEGQEDLLEAYSQSTQLLHGLDIEKFHPNILSLVIWIDTAIMVVDDALIEFDYKDNLP